MADENYAIKVSFDGIDQAIADFQKLQTAVANIKAPVFNLGGDEATKIAEASLKKLQLEINALEQKKAQSAANDITRADQVAAKQEQSAQRLLAQLEKQDAVAQRRLTQGNLNGNNADEKIAIRNAKLYEEQIRLKQQLNAIKNTAFSEEDRAKAEAFAQSINKINVQKIEKEFAQVNVGTRNFIGNMQDASAQLQVLAGKLNEIKGNAQAAFAELDTARKKLSTISDDANGLVKALGKVAETNKFQATTAQLAGAAYEVQSAGFSKTADTTKILEASLRGSVGGFSDVTTVSKATISVLNAYGLGADQAAATVDKFTAVQQSGLITVDQYAAQISRVAPVAAAAGVSLDQLNGFIATATASGVPVESAFAGLRQALASTIKPSSDATKEAERLGIQFDSTALRTKGLNGILADVKNSGKATGDTFSKLFGSIEAVAAIQPAINDLGKLESNIKASGESAGLTDKNFNKAASSLKGFANEAQDALAQLGERINNTANFNPLIISSRALITAFRALPESAQNIIAVVVGLGASFVAISAAITGVLAVTQPTIAAFGLMATAIFGKASADATATATAGASTTATIAQGAAQTATAIATKASALATALYTAATTPLTGSLIATNAQLLIKNTQLALVAGRTAIAGAASAAYAGATNILTGSLTAATGAASALLIPLGLAAAAAGVLFAQIKANQIAESLDSLNATGVGVKALGDEAIKSATKAQTFSNQLKTLTAEGKKAGTEQIEAAKNLVKANEERLKALAEQENKVKNGGAIDETKGTRDAQLLDLKASQNALKGQNDNLKEQIKLNETNAVSIGKSSTAAKETTEELKKQAIALKETQNQDSERGIKRSFDDGKAKRDLENANVIKAIEERNAIAKGELDRKQALETESLKERQTLALQDKQKAFDDAQNAKKLQREEEIDARKRANEERLNKLKEDFDNKQNKLKEERAEKQRKDDEAFANARAERDRRNSEALSGAKQLVSNEGAIATAKPEDKAKIAAQLAEENRIRSEAVNQGTGGAQTQEQLVAKAKEIARVQAIASAEEQRKVQLALDELEKANKAKQSELDKAEDKKRADEKRAADKAFDEQQKADKKIFEEQIKKDTLEFERSVLKPEKQKLEKELQAEKLTFERTELAALKKQQAAEERALKQQQDAEDRELKKKSDAEIEAVKQTQKQKELELDRAFEDAKIERDRAFKQQQRDLDKASAIEIQQILGQSAQQIIDAIAVAKGGTALSSAVGVGNVPKFASGVTNFVGGAALVGEQGAELVTLPRGSNVIPANQTKNILNNSGGNKNYTFNITPSSGDPMAIARQIQREQVIADALRSGV